MDVLDKFLHSIAYKFPKGYPDMDDEQDKIILENEFTKIGITLNEILSPNAQQALDILKKEFDLKDNNFLSNSSTSFKVLMDDSERRDFLKKVSELNDFEFELVGSSSVGRLKYQPVDFKKPILIYAKPSNAQGLGSAGKQNEDNFIRNINEKIAEAGGMVDIDIIAPNSETLSTKDVTEVKDSSKSGAGKGAKSDAQFIGGTFSKDDKDFKLDNNKITVQAAKIYRNLQEIKDTNQEPVFIIAQHSNMPNGLDFRLYPANKTKLGPRSKGIRLSYNEIMK